MPLRASLETRRGDAETRRRGEGEGPFPPSTSRSRPLSLWERDRVRAAPGSAWRGSPRPRVPASPRLILAAVAIAATLLATPASAAALGPARDAWWQGVAETATVGAAEAVSQEQVYA